MFALYIAFKFLSMYTIINKTTGSKMNHVGSWPSETLEKMLNEGDRLIVISSYSNTIKVPYLVKENGIKSWEWEEYPFFKEIIKRK